MKKSAAAMASQWAARNVRHEVGRSGTGPMPWSARSGRSWIEPADGQGSSVRPGSAGSPTSDCPAPFGSSVGGSRAGRLAGRRRVEPSSISARSAGDATAESYPASPTPPPAPRPLAQGMAPAGQPAALRVREPRPSAPELRLEDTVLLSQIVNHVELVAIHPPGQSHQQNPPANDVDHAPSLSATDCPAGYSDLGGISG